MNHPTYFTVPEEFTVHHQDSAVKGRVLERSTRRLTVQLLEPHGILYTVQTIHPSVGGRLGFEGSAGDSYKAELLIHLHQRAQQLQQAVAQLCGIIRTDHRLRERVLGTLRPVIGSYAPFNAFSFVLACQALQHRPITLPHLPATDVPTDLLHAPDLLVLLYQALLP